MKKLSELSKDERSLLIYLETCLVDQRGRVMGRKMNQDDWNIMEQWEMDGFVKYGRVAFDDYMQKMGEYWVELSNSAWKLAHQERKARSERMIEKREWIKTEELHGDHA